MSFHQRGAILTVCLGTSYKRSSPHFLSGMLRINPPSWNEQTEGLLHCPLVRTGSAGYSLLSLRERFRRIPFGSIKALVPALRCAERPSLQRPLSGRRALKESSLLQEITSRHPPVVLKSLAGRWTSAPTLRKVTAGSRRDTGRAQRTEYITPL